MKRFSTLLFVFSIVILHSCGGATVKENFTPDLNGTYVGNSGTSIMVTLTLNGGDKSFTYKERGGISTRDYTGTFALLGQTVIFKSSDGVVTKHKISGHSGGFMLTCIENMKPISFKFEPVGAGEKLKYFKQ